MDNTSENENKIVDIDAKRIEKENKEEDAKNQEDKTPVDSYWVRYLDRKQVFAYTLNQDKKYMMLVWDKEKRVWRHYTDESDITNEVSHFLRREHPKRYTNRNIQTCVSMTQKHVFAFGRYVKKTRDFIISTNSHFLKVTEDGTVKALCKDELGGACKKYFTAIHVDIDLNKHQKMGVHYVPQTEKEIIAKNGYFGKLITLSFLNKDNRECAQEFLGDTLNPQLRKAFPVLIGEPDGGKSQILDVLMGIHKNSTTIDLDRLDTFDTERMLGQSLVVVDEIGKRFSEKHFKQLIGGARINIQRKDIKNLSIEVDFKVVGADNAVFGFSEKTGAIETRIFLIKASFVPEEKRIETIGKKVLDDENEFKDAFDWFLEGALRVVKRGRLLRHNEMPGDSKNAMQKITDRMNPCVQFLKESGAKPSEFEIIPKKDLYRQFVNYCQESGHSLMAKVGYETWCRDYFKSAIKQLFPEGNKNAYNDKLERRATVMINGERKRVECFPLTFENLPEYFGKSITFEEARRTYSDKDAYEDENLPDHIVERLKLEAEEMQKTLNLTKKQKEAYYNTKMLENGYSKGKNGEWFKGDSSIQF